MGQSSDQIRQELDQQRADAGQRIDDLQHQVQDTADQAQQQVKDTAENVRETAEHVRDQVQGTVEDAVESVQNFDVQQAIQDRPLLALGLAVVGGFVLGGVTGGDDDDDHRDRQRHDDHRYDSRPRGGSRSGGMGAQLRSAAQKSGLEDTFSNAAAALMGSVADQVKGSVDRSFPGFSDRLETTHDRSGSFSDKVRAAQEDVQTDTRSSAQQGVRQDARRS